MIVSDETSGPITRGDMPVAGSGIAVMQIGKKYILDGMFLNDGLAALN